MKVKIVNYNDEIYLVEDIEPSSLFREHCIGTYDETNFREIDKESVLDSIISKDGLYWESNDDWNYNQSIHIFNLLKEENSKRMNCFRIKYKDFKGIINIEN